MFLKKLIYMAVVLSSFLYGVIAAHYSFFPYSYLLKIKNQISFEYKPTTYADSLEAISSKQNNVLSACNNPKNKDTYSFYIAGHIYGDPNNKITLKNDIYQPFKKSFKYINDCKSMIFGFLLGDLVREASNKSFKIIKSNLKEIKPEIKNYFIPGNHDVGFGSNNAKRDIFIQNFGKTFQYFEYQDDLFLLLDSNLDNWNISNEQLAMLIKLNSNKKIYRNVFLFTHHVIWYDHSDEVFSQVEPNSLDGFSNKTNFWSDIYPLLEEIGKKVFVFAGDVGAFPNNNEFFYTKLSNVEFFATGMGGGQRDNLLVVSVIDGNTSVKLVPLN